MNKSIHLIYRNTIEDCIASQYQVVPVALDEQYLGQYLVTFAL